MTFEREKNRPADTLISRVRFSLQHAFAWLCLPIFILTTLHSSNLLASQIAYAQSPHTPENKSREILNLFDGLGESSWCSTPAAGTSTHHVQLALKEKVKVEHIEVILSSLPSEPLNIEISNGKTSVAFALVGKTIHLEFETPFIGQVFDFYFKRGPEQAPLCIAELKILSGGKNLVKLPRGVDHSYITLAGAWFEGPPGTTEKTLVFAIDGTWSWIYKPFLGEEQRKLSGTYEIHGTMLTLRMQGSRKLWQLPLLRKRVLIDPNDFNAPDRDYDTLVLKGPQPHIIAGSYNNARFDALN